MVRQHRPHAFPYTWIHVRPHEAVILYKVGLLCLRAQDASEAELSLTEANHLDPRNGEIWLALCEVCLMTQRGYEANLALRRAVKCGFANTQKETLR